MQDILSGRYKQRRMKGSTIMFDPQEYITLAKAVKYWMGKGLTKYEDVANKIAADFGEEVRPKLPTVWAELNKNKREGANEPSPLNVEKDVSSPDELSPRTSARLADIAAELNKNKREGANEPPPLNVEKDVSSPDELPPRTPARQADIAEDKKIQRIAFWVVIIVIGMCLYPPWMRYNYLVSKNTPHKWQISSKYAFLFTPPEIIDSNGEGTTASIDIHRLLVQCAVVILAGGGLSFFYGRYLAKLKLIADKQNSNREMLIKNRNQEMVIINKNLLGKTVENTYTKTEKIPIICPQCHKRLFGATKDMVGETGICPKCKAEFIIEEKKY